MFTRFRVTGFTILLATSVILAGAPPHGRALWVWNATSVLEAGARRAFLQFCHQRGVDTAWVQVSLQGEGSTRSLSDASAWRAALRESHAAGVAIHALDGSPHYAETSGHETPLALADAIIDFNAGAVREERFDGLHLDNEPYLLVGWRDRRRREGILSEFLTLNATLVERARQAGGLQVGIDIPFWWQSRDAATGEAVGAVTFRGSRKAASLHALDLLDTVGIMDYRTRADGPDGLVAHVTDLLRYADGKGKARVYVGIETSTADTAAFRFVTGIPADRFDAIAAGDAALPAALQGPGLVFMDTPRGVAIGVKASEADSRMAGVTAAAAELGARSDADAATALVDVLGHDPEWQGARVDPSPGGGPTPVTTVSASRVMLAKLTFAGRSNAEMDRELARAESAFSAHRSYAGIAIHHYDSYRVRFDARPPAAPHFTPGSNR